VHINSSLPWEAVIVLNLWNGWLFEGKQHYKEGAEQSCSWRNDNNVVDMIVARILHILISDRHRQTSSRVSKIGKKVKR
jgi:hypothetical protein